MSKATCRGQSLFELVFAIAIATIILLGIVSLATVSVRNSSSSRENALANRYAQEVIEWLRQQRDDTVGWSTFVSERSGVNRTWCINDSPGMDWDIESGCTAGTHEINGNTIYLREVILNTQDIAPGTSNAVEATVNVTWTDAQGAHTVTHSARFTDWQ